MFDEGVEKGVAIGIEKGKLETARNLLRLGLPDRTILEGAQITEAQLESLKKEEVL